MSFNATVLAEDSMVERQWALRISGAAQGLIDLKIGISSETAPETFGQLVFVDSQAPAEMLAKVQRAGRAVFLIMDEKGPMPRSLIDGRVDDVLLWPFRPLELLGKIYRFQQMTMWDEVGKLNASFTDLLAQIKGDLELAERLQKSKLPIRFPEVKGFKIVSRYLAGMRSGGDHVDLAESQDKSMISILLSDASSYGLASNMLSVLMRVAMKLSVNETRSSIETVKRIQEEVLLTLNEKDKLSLFYGVVSRKDYRLRYLNLGSACAYYARPGQPFSALPGSGAHLTLKSGAILEASQQELTLDPDGRLVLLSDGFVEAVGGTAATYDYLNQLRSRDASDIMNELVFKVKSAFQDPDDMPAQDCTCIVFDVEPRLIRLAPGSVPV